MQRRSNALLLPGLAVLALAACGDVVDPGEEQPGPTETFTDTFPVFDAEGTAESLNDSARAVDGVFSLVKNLAIGVYAADGTRLTAGAEYGPDDLWIYDFLVPHVARLAAGEPYPFADFHARLASVEGVNVTAEELLAGYRDTYAAHPDTFLVQLLDAMGLDFAGTPETVLITPLQELLLIVDAFVEAPVALAAYASGGVAGAEEGICDGFNQVHKHPGYGLASSAWDAVGALDEVKDALKSFLDPKDWVLASILHVGVEAVLTPTEATVTKTGQQRVVATAAYVFDFPEDLVSCGPLAGIELPPDGPIKDMRVDWFVEGELTPDHGVIRGPTDQGYAITFTDDAGQTWAQYESDEQMPGVPVEERTADGTLTADFNIQQALGNFWSPAAAALELVADRQESARIEVRWQETVRVGLMVRERGGAPASASAYTTEDGTANDLSDGFTEPEPVGDDCRLAYPAGIGPPSTRSASASQRDNTGTVTIAFDQGDGTMISVEFDGTASASHHANEEWGTIQTSASANSGASLIADIENPGGVPFDLRIRGSFGGIEAGGRAYPSSISYGATYGNCSTRGEVLEWSISEDSTADGTRFVSTAIDTTIRFSYPWVQVAVPVGVHVSADSWWSRNAPDLAYDGSASISGFLDLVLEVPKEEQ